LAAAKNCSFTCTARTLTLKNSQFSRKREPREFGKEASTADSIAAKVMCWNDVCATWPTLPYAAMAVACTRLKRELRIKKVEFRKVMAASRRDPRMTRGVVKVEETIVVVESVMRRHVRSKDVRAMRTSAMGRVRGAQLVAEVTERPVREKEMGEGAFQELKETPSSGRKRMMFWKDNEVSRERLKGQRTLKLKEDRVRLVREDMVRERSCGCKVMQLMVEGLRDKSETRETLRADAFEALATAKDRSNEHGSARVQRVLGLLGAALMNKSSVS
jgi:hypothetical protein